MGNFIQKDWKYIIMLLTTIAGIFSPWWLTQVQSSEKDLIVNIVSQSALQPQTVNIVSDLQIILDRKILIKPYLSVIRISNEGTKPILTKDFEGPLEVQLGLTQTPVRATVSAKVPEDIKAEVELSDHAIRLKPTLLNPKDSITVEIISTGGLPKLAANARIASVGMVQIRNATNKSPQPLFLGVLLFLAFVSAILFAAVTWRFIGTEGFTTPIVLRNRTILLLGIVSFVACEMALINVMDEIDMLSVWRLALGMLLLLVVALPFARMLERTSDVVDSTIK